MQTDLKSELRLGDTVFFVPNQEKFSACMLRDGWQRDELWLVVSDERYVHLLQ